MEGPISKFGKKLEAAQSSTDEAIKNARALMEKMEEQERVEAELIENFKLRIQQYMVEDSKLEKELEEEVKTNSAIAPVLERLRAHRTLFDDAMTEELTAMEAHLAEVRAGRESIESALTATYTARLETMDVTEDDEEGEAPIAN